MKKFLRGFQFAWNGLAYTFQSQVNFRVQVLTAVAVVGLGIWLDLDHDEWLWIVFSVGIVLLTEIANTAAEKLVDLISPEFNLKAGLVKDISAGAVLVSALIALAIGALIIIPKLVHAS